MRRETGKKYVVKVHCDEGVAIHVAADPDDRGTGQGHLPATDHPTLTGPMADPDVLERGDRERPLCSIRLVYVGPAGWLWPIGSSMDPSMQILDPEFEILTAQDASADFNRTGVRVFANGPVLPPNLAPWLFRTKYVPL